MMESATSESIVFVIDDDTSVRAAVKDLLESVGLRVFLFESAAEFIEEPIPDASCCMVLDVLDAEMSGLKLQEELLKAEVQVPIVFISGHGIAMAVRAMKPAPWIFLAKRSHSGFARCSVRRVGTRSRPTGKARSLSALRERFSSLSVKECFPTWPPAA
jgi:FixJ family two-component response regulator